MMLAKLFLIVAALVSTIAGAPTPTTTKPVTSVSSSRAPSPTPSAVPTAPPAFSLFNFYLRHTGYGKTYDTYLIDDTNVYSNLLQMAADTDLPDTYLGSSLVLRIDFINVDTNKVTTMPVDGSTIWKLKRSGTSVPSSSLKTIGVGSFRVRAVLEGFESISSTASTVITIVAPAQVAAPGSPCSVGGQYTCGDRYSTVVCQNGVWVSAALCPSFSICYQGDDGAATCA
ncbi:uncharacterized protein BJ171DRAFT_313802 [Polychytrium aggregatum]|uniref:uncharacterized protein n=1 Tax=Polychytrium aggregatum TaxID=110093 RepID=UPI0022FE9F94|nr:uncharacterized protein BJ171DRAFT_313802 [Polychytrium aggregatum]KAI9193113.1 hypothetical protein BJ171DRAFT_313802 [Polychytrium aggregatum]